MQGTDAFVVFAFSARRLLCLGSLVAVISLPAWAPTPPALASTLPAGGSAAQRVLVRPQVTTELSQAQSLLEQQLGDYMHESPHSYSSGVWRGPSSDPCWYCYDTAAVGAATVGRLTDNTTDVNDAIATFNTAIAKHQLASGAFADDTGAADGVATGFFLVGFGVADLELRPYLSAKTRAAWAESYASAAQYLVNSGDTTWYINGNVMLRQTEVMWLAYAITGDSRFLNDYNSEWSFTVSPSQSRWPGYGLQYTTVPSDSDGADGAAYLAESDGSDGPGYDPNYTSAQLDTATDLYVLTRDPRYLRLMNLLFNQLQPRISSTWILDATGGTRDSFDEPFLSAAVSVLAASGERPDLVADPASQLEQTESSYQQSDVYSNVNFSKGFESWLCMPLLNQEWPNGMAPASSIGSTGTDETAAVAGPVVVTDPGRVISLGQKLDVIVRHLSASGGTVSVAESVAAARKATVKVTAHSQRLTVTLHPSSRLLRQAARRHKRIEIVSTVESGGKTRRFTRWLRIDLATVARGH